MRKKNETKKADGIFVTLYGVTFVDTEEWFVKVVDDEKPEYAATKTVLFTDRKECIKYAISEAIHLFVDCEFENDVDENGCRIEDIVSDLKRGIDDVIQCTDHHYKIEFFQQEMFIEN